MEIVADLHLHSRFSRAVSQQMNLHTMATYAKQKGIDLLTIADWTHPVWLKETQTQLEESANGIYHLKKIPDFKDINFLLSTEISLIYKQDTKVRRIHVLLLAPNFLTAEKVNQTLKNHGANLSSDGRPIIGMSCHDLLELILSIDEKCLLIPCHVWTPHFGLYGSASGFDSIDEAFGDLSNYIYGIETGLSSDPDMNWQLHELDNRSILSFSDAHSPTKMGRELTILTQQGNGIKAEDNKLIYDYDIISAAIKREKSAQLKVGYTVEFYPEEGKYHYSGHRNCKVSYSPVEIKKNGNICSVCHKRLTEGVLIRVQELSGKDDVDTAEKRQNTSGLLWYIDSSRRHPPYIKLVPLLEIIAESLRSTVSSKKSQNIYLQLCKSLDSELNVLVKATIEDIKRVGGEAISTAIQKVRGGDIFITPGFDGEYGNVRIWHKLDISKNDTSQLSLDF